METSRRTIALSVATLFPVLLASVFAALARVPEGYEVPITFYFACFLASLILTAYTLFPKKNRTNDIVTASTLIFVAAFFGSNLTSRSLIRWVTRFPDDPVLILIFDVLSLPVIAVQRLVAQLSLEIPWSFGLATSIFLLLVYWKYSGRLSRRIGLYFDEENSETYHTSPRHGAASERIEKAGILLLSVFAASIRTLPALASDVPAGADTPFYVAAIQGRIQPTMFGGFLRHLLYYLFRIIGVVLSLPFPTSLRSIWAVNVIPIVFHTIAVILTYNLVKSCFKDLKLGILAGVFLATSAGMLRITWDLYKLLLPIAFALISIQQLARSIEVGDRRRGLLGLFFFTVTILSHMTLGGIIFLAISSHVLVETLFGEGFFSRSPRILYGIVSLIVLSWFLGRILSGPLFSGRYSGNITGPLPNQPEVGVISINELFRWLGITPLILCTLGFLRLSGKRGIQSFPSSWLTISFLLIWQALFHTYTRTGQIHRVELLTSIPVAILGAVGLFKLLNPLRGIRHRKIGISLNATAILVLTLSSLIIAWNYGGFLSWAMIDEPEYVSMTWLIGFAPNTNCGVPPNFDSWTGYYGQIQNPELPTTFYIDRTATDNSPLYNRIYSGFNRIYLRTDLILA